QTRSMARGVRDQGGISQMFNEDFNTYMFACFLSQEEPKRIHQALKDPSWIEAMQEELLQFKMQKVWILVDLPYGKRAIGTKWVYRNKKDERGMLSDGSTNPKNTKNAHTDGKEHDDDIQMSVSLDIHFSSYGDLTREQGDKAENKNKGKSHVVTITGFKDLNEEFVECFNNSSNEVNAISSLVSAAGLNFTNSTNDFSVAGPSNTAMPNLEDLSHNADDVDDVGAEADINTMESIISVSPIPTSKIYKDHPTSQIIVDLSSTTQTRSMARGVRDQGGISQMFNEDFYTYMFACFLSQEEPKRIHQALKDPSWIEAMQEELLQFKMQKVWILVDLPYGKRAIGTKWVY
nr:hypothetical protein [Tanacetum cinerariifolium]